MIKKKYLIILVLLIVNCAFAQQSSSSNHDSLSAKSFDYLQSRFNATIYDRNISKVYVKAWLKKAKTEEKNYYQLALAYKASIINADKASRLFHVDSMISFAKRTKNYDLIGSSYMTKGIVHYDCLEHMKALDNYLIADQYISQTGNLPLVYKIKYGIALTKYYLGFYDEAISLLRECVTYFKDENDRAYLNSLHSLSLCYNHTGNYQLATSTNQLGIDEGRSFDDIGMEFYFNHAEGINQCSKGNYRSAIRNLSTALPEIIRLGDHANEALTYFYLGKSYWSLKQTQKAIYYFKKVDQIFKKEKCILPDLRKAYEYLIDYYKQNKDTKSQLLYINQLLVIDRLLAKDYKYLLKKIVKEYDTKELIKAKKEIEFTILLTRIFACLIILSMAMIIVHLVRRNTRNRKLFEELMKRDTTNQIVQGNFRFGKSDSEIVEISEIINGGKVSAQDISPEVETAIVKKLEKFELAKKYLEKDMTLSKMATYLNTNSKYVTKVIAKHRGKGTIEYITDLKINYVIQILKSESKYRNYTNKALGEEAGFGSTQNFTRAFKSHTGITPTYFINKLKKSITADSSS